MQILKPFLSNSAMMKMMIKDTVDIENIADEPTIIYIIYPDEVHTMDFIVNLFFSQAYEILIQKAESNESGKLPIRVNFIIDEFGNLPSIEDFSNRISKSRSANIRFSLSVQSLQQIEEKYVKSYESIISNCALWIVFPSREMALLNRLSDIGGKVIDFNGVSHPLLDPIELQYLEKTYEYAEVIILKMGLRPYMTRLKDYRHIAEYKEEISPNEVGVIHMAPYGKCVRDENYILSFEQWYSLIRAEKEGFKMPFPINSHYNEKNSKRFQEELDKKYDNIFGTGTND
jgi:type IV secretion system protein VirD4